jgi:hypothetical protein
VPKNRRNQRSKATPVGARPRQKAPDAPPQSDTPHPEASDDAAIAPPAHDLVAPFKAASRMLAAEPKTLTTISQYPSALRWSVELLARRAGRSQEAAVAFLLSTGLPTLWRWGVDEIRRARTHILAHGTTDDRYWLDASPPLEIATARTGTRRHVVRIADSARSEAGNLASTVALPVSQILILGVMAGLLGADVVPPSYRAAIVETLRAFRRLVARRAAAARKLVDATPITDRARVEAGWRVEQDLWTPEESGDE